MLSPTEGKEIHERVMAELESGREMTPEDVAALMRAAESGYAPAQNAYANVLGNVEGNLLAALPWYCKAVQQGEQEARNTLRELYASEALVREQVSKYLSVQELIELRKPRGCCEESPKDHSPLVWLIVLLTAAIGVLYAEGASILCLIGGVLLAVLVIIYNQYKR